MNWEGPARWINTILLVIVGLIGFDTLFRLLEANAANVIVGFVRGMADVLLAPFQDMFVEQEYLLTALIAVLGYSLAAGVLLAILRAVQASRPEPSRRERELRTRDEWPQSARDPGQRARTQRQPSFGQGGWRTRNDREAGDRTQPVDSDRTQPVESDRTQQL